MASIYLGLNLGDETMSPDKVQEGASTNSTDVELRIDTGKSMSRLDVTNLTEAILRALQDGRSTYFVL